MKPKKEKMLGFKFKVKEKREACSSKIFPIRGQRHSCRMFAKYDPTPYLAVLDELFTQ